MPHNREQLDEEIELLEWELEKITNDLAQLKQKRQEMAGEGE